MKLKDYINDCKDFAEKTKEWNNIDDKAFYTTNGLGWEETCDNCFGGIDVSWAFHKSDKEIEEEAPEEFIYLISLLIRLARDDEWEPEQLDYIINIIE